MELIASKQIKGYTVEVHIVADRAAECEWFAIGAYDDMRSVTLATIPCVSMKTDAAMIDYFESVVEAIGKFGTLPPYAPNNFFSARALEKEVADF